MKRRCRQSKVKCASCEGNFISVNLIKCILIHSINWSCVIRNIG